jgi:hypothetical protein
MTNIIQNCEQSCNSIGISRASANNDEAPIKRLLADDLLKKNTDLVEKITHLYTENVFGVNSFQRLRHKKTPPLYTEHVFGVKSFRRLRIKGEEGRIHKKGKKSWNEGEKSWILITSIIHAALILVPFAGLGGAIGTLSIPIPIVGTLVGIAIGIAAGLLCFAHIPQAQSMSYERGDICKQTFEAADVSIPHLTHNG